MDFSRYGARRRCAGVAMLLALGVATDVRADDNPGYDRPGMGFTPAVLRAGDATWEQGLPDAGHQGGSTLYSADGLLRLGLGHALELQAGSSWNEWHAPGGDRRHGRGDSSLGLKFALPAGDGRFSWGLLGSVEFTDGARDFRADARQYLLGAAFNWQWDARQTLALYVQNVRAGGRDSPLVAVSDGFALTPALSAYVEAGWLHDAGAGSGGMAGAGLAWMATPRVQLDASARHRLAGTVNDWEAGLGISVYFGR